MTPEFTNEEENKQTKEQEEYIIVDNCRKNIFCKTFTIKDIEFERKDMENFKKAFLKNLKKLELSEEETEKLSKEFDKINKENKESQKKDLENSTAWISKEAQGNFSETCYDKRTGLSNRMGLRTMTNYIEKEKEVVSVFILDGDYFKFFNEILGAAYTDFLINIIAKHIHNMSQRLGPLNKPTFGLRYGGEEFIVFAEIEKDQFLFSINRMLSEIQTDIRENIPPRLLEKIIDKIWKEKYNHNYPIEEIRKEVGGCTVGLAEFNFKEVMDYTRNNNLDLDSIDITYKALLATDGLLVNAKDQGKRGSIEKEKKRKNSGLTPETDKQQKYHQRNNEKLNITQEENIENFHEDIKTYVAKEYLHKWKNFPLIYKVLLEKWKFKTARLIRPPSFKIPELEKFSQELQKEIKDTNISRDELKQIIEELEKKISVEYSEKEIEEFKADKDSVIKSKELNEFVKKMKLLLEKDEYKEPTDKLKKQFSLSVNELIELKRNSILFDKYFHTGSGAFTIKLLEKFLTLEDESFYKQDVIELEIGSGKSLNETLGHIYTDDFIIYFYQVFLKEILKENNLINGKDIVVSQKGLSFYLCFSQKTSNKTINNIYSAFESNRYKKFLNSFYEKIDKDITSAQLPYETIRNDWTSKNEPAKVRAQNKLFITNLTCNQFLWD